MSVREALGMVARMRDAVARAAPGRMTLHADIAALLETIPVSDDIAACGMAVKPACVRLQYYGCEAMGQEALAWQVEALTAIDALEGMIAALDDG